MSKVVFFRAGCPVCGSAAAQFVRCFDPARCEAEVWQPFHIDVGAALADRA